MKKIAIAIFNHNYSSFIMNYSFIEHTVFITIIYKKGGGLWYI